jgi:hypothetical protein
MLRSIAWTLVLVGSVACGGAEPEASKAPKADAATTAAKVEPAGDPEKSCPHHPDGGCACGDHGAAGKDGAKAEGGHATCACGQAGAGHEGCTCGAGSACGQGGACPHAGADGACACGHHGDKAGAAPAAAPAAPAAPPK